MACSPPRLPLICVLGATGTGKSQLAVEIAKRHNGEIINGDAMQLYAGLPIITNKITPQEQEGIPHHLLGCIGLGEETWVVGAFVQRALKTIEEIRSRGKLPILVGGTHYYTEGLLFRDRLVSNEGDHAKDSPDLLSDPGDKWPVLNEPTDVILREVERVDPVMADRWHPNDRRKIQRTLQIYLQTGRRASDIYAEQRTRKHQPEAGMRFSTLLFWVHTETQLLRDRLDRRVEKMLLQGLEEEVQTLTHYADTQAATGNAVDEGKGIWVSIGYKQFKEVVKQAPAADTSVDEALLKKRQLALEATQAATRQYAKRQIRWIRVKLLNALVGAHAADRLYLLDSTNSAHFDADVVRPATDLTQKFLQGQSLPPPASFSPLAAADMLVPAREDFSATPHNWSKHHCVVCDVTCVTPEQWHAHVTSRPHRKLQSKRDRHTFPSQDG